MQLVVQTTAVIVGIWKWITITTTMELAVVHGRVNGCFLLLLHATSFLTKC